MRTKRSFRKRLIADVQVQGALAVRVVLYWLLCLFVIGILLLLARLIARPMSPLDRQLHDLWSLLRPTALASLALLPIVVLDVLRLSNRFAGPIFRLRRAMRDLARGKPVGEIRLRQGDFWQEFAADFSAVAARLQEAEAVSKTALQPEDSELETIS